MNLAPVEDRLFYTVPEASERLGISASTFYRLVRRGEIGDLPVAKFGRQLRVGKEALHRYAAQVAS